MKYFLILTASFTSFICLAACNNNKNNAADTIPKNVNNKSSATNLSTIAAIAPPNNFNVEPQGGNSFGAWLQLQTLKADKTVYLHNGTIKPYQGGSYAVVNISVPKQDVQQCADALMRMRAEYFYSQKAYDKITFKSVDGPYMAFSDYIKGKRWRDVRDKLTSYNVAPISTTNNNDELRKGFDNYLFLVFSFCNTYSLNLQASNNIATENLQVGDFFIRGGFPGHAVLCVSTAVNQQGERVAMFAQSYMPAQSIHIVLNPKNSSPWFALNKNEGISYTEYTFKSNEAKTW